MLSKCRSKVKEDETRTANNWNKHFDKLKETHSEEQGSNKINNLLRYVGKPTTNDQIFQLKPITKNRLSQLAPITQPQSTKILNLSNVPFSHDEKDILKPGLSFTPTPTQNIGKLENIFQFPRKLRLTYHYRNSNIVNEAIVKLESTKSMLI